MPQRDEIKLSRKPRLINSKTVFFSTLIVVFTLTLITWLTGIREHRSVYLNSLISTTILSVVFLSFITAGLYNGWKLKDNLGNLLDKVESWKRPPVNDLIAPPAEAFDVDPEGCVAGLIVIVLWIVIGMFGAIILWAIGSVFWAAILVVAGLLYWIIFRAYRLIFKNSAECKGNFFKSISTGILFTILYNCWIYGIILATHFLKS